MDFKLLNAKIIKEDTKMNKIIEEMIKEIKGDKEVMKVLKAFDIKDEAIIRNNIATLSTFKEDLDYCRKCPGFYNCDKKHRHYIFSLKFNGRFLDKSLQPCDLKMEDNKLEEHYLKRDFPAIWRTSTVAKLDKSKVRLPLIKRFKDVIDNNKNWIYITGSHRSGKSYVAATLLNDLIKLEHGQGAFLNYPSRVRDLQDYSYSNKEDFASLMKLYTSVDYLVLDDFGNEYKNEFVRDSITLAILNERARRGLITIFTSEFSFEEISYMYSLNAAGKARGHQLKNLLTTYAEEAIDITTAAIY